MDRPRQFGGFLLFRENETNAYRTSYRAGVSRGRTIDRIVRLEVFDGVGLDSDRMLAHLEGADQLQARISDPHIARGVGLGHSGGIPYAAYEFELGTTLSTFLGVARDKSFPVPFDQALFVAERIALALAAARQIEHGGNPVLHSFLTPDSVLLSNEGGVKVLGFETGAALREQLSGDPSLETYLAPECRAGEAPADQDDVYSLGAILYELVSGGPFRSGDGDIEELLVQATGEPASASLKQLLGGSFAPGPTRIANVMDWQQTLGKLILDGEYNPTTFNLAFLMHTIMRDRLEQDVQNLKHEKSFLLTPQTESELATETDSRVSALKVPVEEPTEDEPTTGSREMLVAETAQEKTKAPPNGVSVHDQPVQSEEDEPGARPFWVGFAASAIVGGIALGVFLLSGSKSPSEELPPEVPAVSLSQPQPADGGLAEASDPSSQSGAPTESAEPSGTETVFLSEVVNGELGAQAEEAAMDQEELERLIAERAQAIERDLKAEYEAKLESLRAAAAERQREAETDTEARAGAQRPDSLETPTEIIGAAPPNAGPAAPIAGADEPAPPAATGNRDPQLQVAPSETAPALADQEAAQAPATVRSTDAGATERPSASQTRAPEQPQQTKAPEPEPSPPAKIEALIRAAPKLLRLGAQVYPTQARRLGLSAKVRVKVLIGINGKVLEAEVIGNEVGNGFDAAALTTVRRSRWQPGTTNGEPVEAWTSVSIDFRP